MGANAQVLRLAYGEEATIYATPGAFVKPGGLFELTPNPDTTMFEDSRQKTSRRENYGPTQGPWAGDLSVKAKISKELNVQWDSVLKTVIGSKSAGGALTVVADSTASNLHITAGTPDGIVRVELSDGSWYIQPVHKLASATNYTMSYPLPVLGGRTVTAVKNAEPTPAGGAMYKEVPIPGTAYEKTYTLEYDMDAEIDPDFGVMKGCVPTEMNLDVTQGDRCYLGFKFQAGESRPGVIGAPFTAPTNTGTPLSVTGDSLPWIIEAYIDTLEVADRPSSVLLNNFKVQLASTWLPQEGARDRLLIGSTYYNPASNITGWVRGTPVPSGIEITLSKHQMSRIGTDFIAGTPYFIHIIMYLGTALQTQGGECISLFIPRAVYAGKPKKAEINGSVGQTLTFTIEELATLVSPFLTKYWFGQFRT